MTVKQWLSIVMVVLGVLTASTAQLNDLLGEGMAKTVISVASMLNSVLAGVLAVITGQSSTVREVQDMPGVEMIVVNRWANRALASMVRDPTDEKISAKPGDERVIEDTATSDT